MGKPLQKVFGGWYYNCNWIVSHKDRSGDRAGSASAWRFPSGGVDDEIGGARRPTLCLDPPIPVKWPIEGGLPRRTTKISTKPVRIAREGVGDFQVYPYDILLHIYCHGLCLITFVRMIYIKSVARFGISLFFMCSINCSKLAVHSPTLFIGPVSMK